jgi:hypothetical protein
MTKFVEQETQEATPVGRGIWHMSEQRYHDGTCLLWGFGLARTVYIISSFLDM